MSFQLTDLPPNPTPPTEVATDARNFPLSQEDIKADPRVSWSRLSNKWSLETDDGEEYEFDEALRRWIPVLDESLLEEQSKIYAVEGVEETKEIRPKKNEKKRKVYTSNEGVEEEQANKKQKAEAAKAKKPPPKNKAVYITNLPPDTTEDDIKDAFSKCGVIAEELDTGKPRIKLYKNEDGTLKGDALVIYHRPESVLLAVQMLDDTDLRFGVQGPTGTIKVQEADFSYKKQTEAPPQQKVNMKEKKKMAAKMQKLNNKLTDWDDDDPSAVKTAPVKQHKTVVLKHMFTLQELEEDPALTLDLKEEIREECEKLGEVSNVILYDLEEDGVVIVRFKDAEAANKCVSLMDGRFFGGQRVEAAVTDGSQKFKKTNTKTTTDAEEEERLEKFAKWLESEQKKGGEEQKEQPENNGESSKV